MAAPYRIIATGLLASVLVLPTSGCGGGITNVLRKPMSAMGIGEKLPQSAPKIELRMYAADNINAGYGQTGHATVLRIYQLKDNTTFQRLPYESFIDQQAAKSLLGNDALSDTEVVLTPGSKQPIQLSLQEATRHIGIVALYLAPTPNRWRFSFDARHAGVEKDGITVGLHACAMTTDSPALLTQVAGDPRSLLTVQCPPLRSR
ncbi:type VI secretion system lipoprotein TssJ [Lysobacteraceae bacterium NML03-0222]|nr:type VI secretion system lipoprotein TssJ [Xanthomonadaceae bacterium NML03-0222]